MEVKNPTTGVTITTLTSATPSSVSQAFEDSARAQARWSQVPFDRRLRAIEKFRAYLKSRRDELARTLTCETGKPIAQATAEIESVDERLNFFVEHASPVLLPRQVFKSSRGTLVEEVRYEPLGVVGNISAWNYPYFVGVNVFVPALLTGNAVLYKPSESASLTGQHIATGLHEAGVPKDIFQLLIGGPEIGQALIEQDLAGVFFTGSKTAGLAIDRALGGRLAVCQLELGGKDPVYVHRDVDVAIAARSVAEGAFYNNGQSCCAVERVYVHQEIYRSFLESFCAAVRGFRVGDPMEEETFIGPLCQFKQPEKLADQISDAVARGAVVRLGGHRLERSGNFFQPTVLSNVDSTMKIMREETFGPVIGIQEVRDTEEAFRCMDDTDYGLTAGVYSRDREIAEALLERLDTGSAYWNCCDRVSPRLPWSGRRGSGLGSTLGLEGLRAFVRPRSWHWKKS